MISARRCATLSLAHSAPHARAFFAPASLRAKRAAPRLTQGCRGPSIRIITRDNGLATLRWVGVRRLSAAALAGARHLTPVLISKGALGNDLPERDMIVSPNHRLLVSQDKTALHFDTAEALVAAKHLTGLVGVHSMPQADVTYINLVFDAHQVILTNGTWSESFRPLLEGDTHGGNAQRTELLEIYPELTAHRTASARAMDSVS